MKIWVLALESEAQQISALEQYLENLWPKVINFGLQLLIAIVVLIVGRKLIGLIRKLTKRALERREADVGVVQFLDMLIKYVLYFMLFLFILGRFGVQATSVLAIAGSAGLTLGLALQGSLSNFAGGVLILLLKPFVVGDYIIEDTYKNEGTVTNIQLFYTTLKTIDGKLVTVPNATLANTSLTNATHEPARMLSIKVGVAYDSDIQKAKDTMLGIFKEDPRIFDEPAPFAVVSELADSAIILEMRGWLTPQDYWDMRWYTQEEIIARFRAQQISIPFPQMDVHMDARGVESSQ